MYRYPFFRSIRQVSDLPAILQTNIPKNPRVSHRLLGIPMLVGPHSKVFLRFCLAPWCAPYLSTVTLIVLLYQSSQIQVSLNASQNPHELFTLPLQLSVIDWHSAISHTRQEVLSEKSTFFSCTDPQNRNLTIHPDPTKTLVYCKIGELDIVEGNIYCKATGFYNIHCMYSELWNLWHPVVSMHKVQQAILLARKTKSWKIDI